MTAGSILPTPDTAPKVVTTFGDILKDCDISYRRFSEESGICYNDIRRYALGLTFPTLPKAFAVVATLNRITGESYLVDTVWRTA